MNIYQQQQANRRKTLWITTLFIAFFAFLGLGFDHFYLGYDPWKNPDARSPISFPLATICAILFSSGWAWWGSRFGDQAILSSAGALRLEYSRSDESYRQLLNVVEEMSIASGLPMPQVYVIPDGDPNAFATGRDAEHSSIAVTQGLLNKMDREELQAVIAHEMSHIRNLDVRLMTTIAALAGAVVLLSDWAKRAMRSGVSSGRSSSRKGKGGGNIIFLVLWLAAVILAPFAAQMLAMAVSREREYLADASAAELTRNPGALADALHKIETDSAPTASIKRGTAHLCIVDPLGRKLGLREGFFADLLATHPPMWKRIQTLKRMAYQSATPVKQ
ncbi:MAG: M48 family metallopeptidase [Acidobacteria bacterium]|nr:M48 family metallopeptidase [Acidobacteriota bacterium]